METFHAFEGERGRGVKGRVGEEVPIDLDMDMNRAKFDWRCSIDLDWSEE